MALNLLTSTDMRALVVFSGGSGVDDFLSRRLKEGFKHCFVVIDDGSYWIRIDGKAGVAEIEVVANSDYDLTSFYRSEGYRVVETYRRDRPMPHLVAGNCVGVVKAVLGLHSWAITPHQLYRRLVP